MADRVKAHINKRNRWRARATIDGERILIGYFASKKEAVDAEDAFYRAYAKPKLIENRKTRPPADVTYRRRDRLGRFA